MKNRITLLLLIILPILLPAHAKTLERVSLQFLWLDHFQFAGYYIAKEKGFYRDVGLDVDFIKFKTDVNLVEKVVAGEATYGIGRSSLIIDKSKGADIKLLSAVFQISPLVLLSLKDSKIDSIQDFVDQRIMIVKDSSMSAEIQSMILDNGISLKDMRVIPHSFLF
jgi:ABC-type nitrate/sulfonate/bicarbonate transport system substrate-binding protein